jgi:hypothetical protein
MKMNFIEKVRQEMKPKTVSKIQSNFRSIDVCVAEVPAVIEKPNLNWVWYGEQNLYPHQLWDLQYGSPIHNSIIKTKTKMMAGDGLLFNGAKTLEESEQVVNSLPPNEKAEVNFLLKNEYGGMPLDKLQTSLSNDFQLYGAYCYEIIYNNDFTKIAGIKYIPVSNIRAGKMVNDKVELYYYSRDWSKHRQVGFKPIEKVAYYKGNKDAINQLVYVKQGSLDYYGIPSYSGALNWIHTDLQMGIFHRANIENGMNPGLHFKFYKLPASQEDEDKIVEGLKKQWQGAQKTGKMVATFSPGKELAMDIAPVEVSNLDKQLLLLAELCDKKILSGHQLTTPLLAGISVSGQLGGNSELEVGYQIFDGIAMASDRSLLNNDIQMWFDFNKTNTQVKINKFKPFETQIQRA